MLSNWLFTTAVVASTLFSTALAAPQVSSTAPSKKFIDLEKATTFNLLEDTLPPYDASKDTDGLLKLTYSAIERLSKEEKKKLGKVSKRNTKRTCNLSKLQIRREWGALTNAQKKSYTSAIRCLMTKPSRSDPVTAPGAKSRYDDFVAVHMLQTLTIHGTANFLSWHRHYVHLFETALRTECGYTAPLPYWNWGNTASQPYPSYIFNDGPYGLSGNGATVPHNPNGTPIGGGDIIIPASTNTGGGCVTTGPFANMTVNLGPLASTLDLVPPVSTGFLGHNPRCLRRTISSWVSSRWSTHAELLDLLLNPSYSTIGPFQNRFQGDFGTGFLGLHAAGHFTVGGDPGGDFFVSPGEPAFWVHHAMVDRVWWLWQNLGPDRINVVAGTITIFDSPPSRNGTLEDLIEMGQIDPEVYTIRDLVSTTDGPYCYIYL